MSFDFTGIGGLADLAKDVIDRCFPDKTKAEEIKAQIVIAQQQGALKQADNEHQERLAQIALDQAEVVAGSHWREQLGRVCVYGFGYQFLANPLLNWLSVNFHVTPPPQIDVGPLSALLVGMLGLGSMHLYQSIKTQ